MQKKGERGEENIGNRGERRDSERERERLRERKKEWKSWTVEKEGRRASVAV